MPAGPDIRYDEARLYPPDGTIFLKEYHNVFTINFTNYFIYKGHALTAAAVGTAAHWLTGMCTVRCSTGNIILENTDTSTRQYVDVNSDDVMITRYNVRAPRGRFAPFAQSSDGAPVVRRVATARCCRRLFAAISTSRAAYDRTPSFAARVPT